MMLHARNATALSRMDLPDNFWLGFSNFALGLVIIVCGLVVVAGVVSELAHPR